MLAFQLGVAGLIIFILAGLAWGILRIPGNDSDIDEDDLDYFA